ncbi:phosphoserine phosphatase SerB [Alphaproteobacteria bacterium]|nr:phosphoserine phosphatase SerB [Alphaproteobacteria bacterium]
MRYNLFLISEPGSLYLSKALINVIKSSIDISNNKIIDMQWLADNESILIKLELEDYSSLKNKLQNLIPKNIDFILLRDGKMRKKLLIADMDSTIIQQECLDEVAKYINKYEQVKKITDLAMEGKIDFKKSLLKRIKLLSGVEESILQDVYNNYITINSNAKSLVKTMKANGSKTLLVSGGFSFFADQIANTIGFDYVESNTLEIKNGILTGLVKEPILDENSKLKIMNEIAQINSIDVSDSIAVGDGANDIPMIKQAGIGVSFRGKSTLRNISDVNIKNGDLSSILYIQGYKKSNFIE